jgi:hypothetical protein
MRQFHHINPAVTAALNGAIRCLEAGDGGDASDFMEQAKAGADPQQQNQIEQAQASAQDGDMDEAQRLLLLAFEESLLPTSVTEPSPREKREKEPAPEPRLVVILQNGAVKQILSNLHNLKAEVIDLDLNEPETAARERKRATEAGDDAKLKPITIIKP